MDEQKVDKTKVDPLTAGEEPGPAQPLKTVPPGKEPNATNAVIPGSGTPIKDLSGKEVGRIVRT